MCRPRAVVGRQRLSLRSSQQRAWKLHGYRQWEAAVHYKSDCRTTTRPSYRPGIEDDHSGTTTTVQALREDTEPQNDADRWGRRSGRFRTTVKVRNDLAVQSDGTVRNDMAVLFNQDVAPPLRRRSSRRTNSPSAKTSTPTRQHSAPLAVLCLLLRSWYHAYLLYVRPRSVLTPFSYSSLVPTVSPYP